MNPNWLTLSTDIFSSKWVADVTEMLAYCLAFWTKSRWLLPEKALDARLRHRESHTTNRFAELSQASVLELSNSGRVLAGFLQLISSFSELLLKQFITFYAVINSMKIFNHEVEENINNIGRSRSLRGT